MGPVRYATSHPTTSAVGVCCVLPALANAGFALSSTLLGLPRNGMQFLAPAFDLELHKPCLSMTRSVRAKFQAADKLFKTLL